MGFWFNGVSVKRYFGKVVYEDSGILGKRDIEKEGCWESWILQKRDFEKVVFGEGGILENCGNGFRGNGICLSWEVSYMTTRSELC